MKKQGTIISHGVHLESHEFDTVSFLADRGWDVELIPPSYIKGQHTADIKMGGIEWEIKSPTGQSGRTIEYTMRKAMRQSENVILDLGRIKMPSEKSLRLAEKQFLARKTMRRLKVITKDKNMLDFSR